MNTLKKHYSTFRALFILLGVLTLANTFASADTITRGPYLQLDSFDSLTVRWITDTATNSRVWYSTDPANLNLIQDDTTVTTDHSVTLTGLDTNTQYYYKVGTTSTVLSDRFKMVTIPDNGHPDPMRFWVLGDSGNNSKLFEKVVKNYVKPADFVPPDLIVLLGDNAYESGSDAEYQQQFFDITGSLLTSSFSVSALGEHDTAGSNNPPPSLPYFQIFDLPSGSDAGGKASGTEKYYSFNFGNSHWVVLDSQASNRSLSGPMLTWLEQDLTDNHRPWLIALWHHSPYSAGNHDSDTEVEMTEMRENANQVLESHGADLVLGAHSNTYERSFLIDGHYGTSDTFVSSMVIDHGDGRINGDGAYTKAADTTDTGTVYVVMGSSGGKTKGKLPLNYPAMITSSKKPGSVAIDLNCAQLDVNFLAKNGKAKDNFTIIKSNIKPTAVITSPAEGATFNAGSNITFNADANDPDTRIRKVHIMSGTFNVGQDFSPPYSVTWNNVPAGSYTITAVAEDELCGNGVSAPIHITVH